MGVCSFCSTRLVLIDYYGLHLCGCVNCNTWEHNGKPAGMSAEDCAASRDGSRQDWKSEAAREVPRVEVRGRDKFKRQ
jgi:hypothetical protein